MSYNLEPVRAAFESLGGLEIPMVHIAGSKGKGTTATLLAKIIQLRGDTVGLFTSPFIEEEIEMVTVNGIMISWEDFERLQERVRAIDSELSTFEVQTLAAFEYFKEQKCDILIVECGMGGLTDATNVATEKALTLLTHVELEHQEHLGHSLSEIAEQKLGICRPGVPLFTVPTQAPEVFEAIRKAGHEVEMAPAFELAFHHPESAGLAIAAADFLGYPMDSVIEEALARLVLPGRFEVLHLGPHTLLLDGAHTYDSVQYVLERVQEFQRKNQLPEPQFGIHFLSDKNSELWTLFPQDRTVWIPLEDVRAGEKPKELNELTLQAFFKLHLSGNKPCFIILLGSFKLLALFQRNVMILNQTGPLI